MSIDIVRLRAWAHSTSTGGARSLANHEFLDALLLRGSRDNVSEMTISVEETRQQGIPCVRLHFRLPQAYHSTGIGSVPVLIPIACLGTGIYQPIIVFYALLEEIIAWLAHACPKNSLVRLYCNNNGQPLARSYSSDWQQLHGRFTTFINSLRTSENQFPGPGQIRRSYGVIEVAQARTPTHQVCADYDVSLTLNNEQRVSLFLPRRVAQLGKDWLLDWLQVQNELSDRV